MLKTVNGTNLYFVVNILLASNKVCSLLVLLTMAPLFGPYVMLTMLSIKYDFHFFFLFKLFETNLPSLKFRIEVMIQN